MYNDVHDVPTPALCSQLRLPNSSSIQKKDCCLQAHAVKLDFNDRDSFPEAKGWDTHDMRIGMKCKLIEGQTLHPRLRIHTKHQPPRSP